MALKDVANKMVACRLEPSSCSLCRISTADLPGFSTLRAQIQGKLIIIKKAAVTMSLQPDYVPD